MIVTDKLIARKETRVEAMNAIQRSIYEAVAGRHRMPVDEYQAWADAQYRRMRLIRAMGDA